MKIVVLVEKCKRGLELLEVIDWFSTKPNYQKLHGKVDKSSAFSV